MATRKKKADVIVSADVAEMPNKSSGGWPKMVQGTHLTVKTFEDGRTELIWDDDALLAEVKAAILKAESTIPVEATPKKTRTKKNGNS